MAIIIYSIYTLRFYHRDFTMINKDNYYLRLLFSGFMTQLNQLLSNIPPLNRFSPDIDSLPGSNTTSETKVSWIKLTSILRVWTSSWSSYRNSYPASTYVIAPTSPTKVPSFEIIQHFLENRCVPTHCRVYIIKKYFCFVKYALKLEISRRENRPWSSL